MRKLSHAVDQARMFALQHHADQRYGDHPYSYHLDAVADLLEPFGETAQVIGYLHDVVEDTDVSVALIEQKFGNFIARAVELVTDPVGKDRQQKKQQLYQVLSRVDGELELALVVKAADRLANVQASVASQRHDKLSMYQAEQADFFKAVYRAGLCDNYWQQLDQLLQN